MKPTIYCYRENQEINPNCGYALFNSVDIEEEISRMSISDINFKGITSVENMILAKCEDIYFDKEKAIKCLKSRVKELNLNYLDLKCEEDQFENIDSDWD